MSLIEFLLPGLVTTMLLFLSGAVIAAISAFAAGLGSTSTDPILRTLSRLFVEVFRGTSLLVQLFWFAFALPLLGIDIPTEIVAFVVPGLNIGAYGAEVVRSALLSVPKEQTAAAVALNLSPSQQLWRVVMPQALMRMLPTFGNLLVELLKATALVSVIFVSDLTKRALLWRDHSGDVVEALAATLVAYFLLSSVVLWLMKRIERRAGGRWYLGTER